MAREPEELAQMRRALGEQLAAFRKAARLTQAQVAKAVLCDRSTLAHLEKGRTRADREQWRIADETVQADGALLSAFDALEGARRQHDLRTREAEIAEARDAVEDLHWMQTPGPKLPSPRPASSFTPIHLVGEPHVGHAEPIDEDYLCSLRQQMQQLLAIDAQCGGDEASKQAVRLFRAVHRRIGTSPCPKPLRSDLHAAAGELAEIAGWLLYDADQQDAARRINQEALYYLRWAGDRSLELLTLQNMAMQAEYLRRPGEALQIVQSILETDRLSPRLQALFLARGAHSLALQGERVASKHALGRARTLYLDGTRDNDPAWAYWIDDRQFAWFEAMVHKELGEHAKAAEIFAQALATSPQHRVRGLYSRTVYLFESLVRAGDWHYAEQLVPQLAPYVHEVGSGRTASILRGALRKVHGQDVPVNLHDGSMHLRGLLDGEAWH